MIKMRGLFFILVILIASINPVIPLYCQTPNGSKSELSLWDKKNLDVVTFNNGDSILQVHTIEDWVKATTEKKSAYCIYGDSSANAGKYGHIYNWYAVNDPRGLAPSGWKIPTTENWNEMLASLGDPSNAGIKLKSIKGWLNNNGKDTSFQFNALPGGYRSSCGHFFDSEGSIITWWTSESDGNNTAKSVSLSSENQKILKKSSNKGSGFYVRCINN
jgi:uncharacterized protein (TIGR02145 family)